MSDRREWTTTHYHSFYNPHCLFELEIRRLVATLCILGDLITQWLQRTGIILSSNQVAFHLVSIPCDPFAEFDALRGKKWRSSQTGEEKYQDIMSADFRAFCVNNNNRSVNFWNELNDLANEKINEKQQKSSNDN
ncbi:unnamed protein product [Adineta steineri]|uniref:DEPDC5 C-terminal domain-containing protein n=1 Tax=Adineta steineri TaxID=433720 RepID=A0A819UQT0_9BILA|nr:unnamed protein product [Adineta steineri]CAF1202851.1 unnamed protein product [Adineta steineri]CAF1434823.1 unnamed protein product [Adineta steineri]CAF4099883.1 unnamed protein product [Adineta steineri]